MGNDLQPIKAIGNRLYIPQVHACFCILIGKRRACDVYLQKGSGRDFGNNMRLYIQWQLVVTRLANWVY